MSRRDYDIDERLYAMWGPLGSAQGIHVASTDAGTLSIHTMVNAEAGSKRGHQNLFMKLAHMLELAAKGAPEWRYLKRSLSASG